LVIDAHVHLYPTPERGAQAKGRTEPPYGTLEELDDALATVLDAAVVANFLPAKLMRERGGASDAELWTRQRRQNEWALEVAQRDERLHVLVGALPVSDERALSDVEAWLSHGSCCGIKLHPSAGDYRADAPAVLELAALAARADKAVMIHAGPFADGHRDVGADELRELARATTGRLVVAHLGGAGPEEAATIAGARADVWLDTSAILTSSTADGARELLARVLDAIGDERLIHGSDVPFFGIAESLDRLRASLPPGTRTDRVLAANATAAYLSATPRTPRASS
jgi:predicted TIM-barrel fold metal-dependent hydrolase